MLRTSSTQLPLDTSASFSGLIFACRIAEIANQDAAFLHAGVEGHEVAIAADEEQSGDQQHHGDGDLRDDHEALHGEAFAAARCFRARRI